MAKLTREMKAQINEQVTNETKRILGIIDKKIDIAKGLDPDDEILVRGLLADLQSRIIKDQPYLQFHPELKEQMPE